MIGARILALLTLFLQPLDAQIIIPRLIDAKIAVSAPNLNFLQGKTLDRLRNGQSVSFDFQIQILDGAKPLARSLQRFVLSYDLWEESYSAVQMSQTSPRLPIYSTARLKPEALAGWCLNRMALPFPAVDKTKLLTLHLEIRSSGTHITNPLRPQGTVDLGVLVELFSRPPDPRELRFTAQSQPFTLSTLVSP